MTETGAARPRAPTIGVHAALLTVQLLFASLGVAAKLVLRELAPRGLIEVRATSAALILLGAWVVSGRERVARRDLAHLALHGLLGIAANQLLFIEGLARTTATNAVVLGASIPVFTTLVALLLKRERATPLKLAGLGVALAGALAVTGLGRFQGGTRTLVGNALVLANSLSFSIYLVVSRGVLARYRTGTVIAFTFLFGALLVQPFGAADFIRGAPALHLPSWLIIGYIVAGPSLGTYVLNAWALARVESSTVAVYVFLQPVLGALLAAVALGERPSLGTALGGAGILAGIWLVTEEARRRRRRR